MMWNDCSNDTGGLPKLNKMMKNDIEGATGMQVVRSLNVFFICMLSQPKTVLYGQKNLCCSPVVMLKNIETVCVILERNNILLPVKY